jgi:hypothetical protein
MKKQILLARPHPFIVSDMKPFLEQNDFTPMKLDGASDLIKLKSAKLNGVIISLAVQSSVDESADMVFAAIRKQFPHLPIAFAGMLDHPLASTAIKRLFTQTTESAHIIGVDENNVNRAELGQATAFVYVRNTDLSSPEKAKIAALILQRHFQ